MEQKPPQRLQDLPPRWARFCLGIRSFAARELAQDFATRPCLVAVSGGADSTALLLITTLLCRMHGGSVQAAHLNHQLRDDAAADQRFVEDLCAGLGVALSCAAQDIASLAEKRGTGIEETAREARYAFLKEVGQATGSELLLVAHHANDLAEDQLLRLTRGCGWPALGGMAGWDEPRRLLRPLLLTPRAELEAFLAVCGQSWRTDLSNFSRLATRNRVRHDLLPGIVAENPAYLEAAARLWRQAAVDADHWQAEISQARRLCVQDEDAVLVPRRLLYASSSALRLRLFKAILAELGPGQALGDALLALDAMCTQARHGKALRFPGDKEARLDKAGLRFRVIDRKKECG